MNVLKPILRYRSCLGNNGAAVVLYAWVGKGDSLQVPSTTATTEHFCEYSTSGDILIFVSRHHQLSARMCIAGLVLDMSIPIVPSNLSVSPTAFISLNHVVIAFHMVSSSIMASLSVLVVRVR